MIPWLEGAAPFPPADTALRQPNGLLAAGGELSPQRLLDAYRCGIFPWYSNDDPVLWWSPDPRMVLVPAEFRLARSLGKRLRRREFAVSTDTAFGTVMQSCAGTPRPGQDGTWIVDAMVDAYTALHELGHAHSVECWQTADNGTPRLVGGLYGVCLGRMFYGESMFSHVTDASKAALAYLVRHLRASGVDLIDCQMKTPHLASLGAREMPRHEFLHAVRARVAKTPFAWPAGPLEFAW